MQSFGAFDWMIDALWSYRVISLALERWSKNIGLADEICCYLNSGMIRNGWRCFLGVAASVSCLSTRKLGKNDPKNDTVEVFLNFPSLFRIKSHVCPEHQPINPLNFLHTFTILFWTICPAFSFWSSSTDLRSAGCTFWFHCWFALLANIVMLLFTIMQHILVRVRCHRIESSYLNWKSTFCSLKLSIHP